MTCIIPIVWLLLTRTSVTTLLSISLVQINSEAQIARTEWAIEPKISTAKAKDILSTLLMEVVTWERIKVMGAETTQGNS